MRSCCEDPGSIGLSSCLYGVNNLSFNPQPPCLKRALLALAGRARTAAASALRRWQPGRGRGSATHRETLHEARIAARHHAEQLGRDFLAIGDALQEQLRVTGRLAAGAAELRALAETETEGNPVRGAVIQLEQALRGLDAAETDGAALVQRLQQQHDAIARVIAEGSQLERAFAPLKIIDTLFRIEAATLPPETQTAFAALTEEIAQLDRHVRETFARNFDALAVTRGAIGAVVGRLTAQRQAVEAMAAAQRREMFHSLAAVQQEMAALRHRDQRARELVERLETSANGAVMALQYQDITRQKLEHVLEAVEEIRPARGDAVTPPATRAPIAHLCELQSRQLRGIQADLDQALGGLRTSMDHVARDIHVLQAETAREGSGVLGAQVAATIDVLRAMLAQMEQPIDEVATNAGDIASALRSFGGITTDLGATIRDLTWAIRLIALNAQVQAAQVSRCDGLEILARNTYLVSEETSGLAERIGTELVQLAQRLDELVAAAVALEGQTRANRTHHAAALSDLGPRLQEQQASVRSALEAFDQGLAEASERARSLAGGGVLAHLDREPLLRLGAAFEALAAVSPRGKAGGIGQELQSLRANYTMESEREVHAALIHDLQASSARPRSPSAPAARPAEPERPALAAATVPVTPGAANLGDNVELF